MRPEDILADGAETYQAKNEDYGDSWRKVGEILHNLADGEPVTLESPEDHIAYGLLTRRLDKIARAYHGELLSEDQNFESVADSHEDEMVYAAMSASNQHNREPEPRSAPTIEELQREVELVQKMWDGVNVDAYEQRD